MLDSIPHEMKIAAEQLFMLSQEDPAEAEAAITKAFDALDVDCRIGLIMGFVELMCGTFVELGHEEAAEELRALARERLGDA